MKTFGKIICNMPSIKQKVRENRKSQQSMKKSVNPVHKSLA